MSSRLPLEISALHEAQIQFYHISQKTVHVSVSLQYCNVFGLD
jgi:hypothetical protein